MLSHVFLQLLFTSLRAGAGVCSNMNYQQLVLRCTLEYSNHASIIIMDNVFLFEFKTVWNKVRQIGECSNTKSKSNNIVTNSEVLRGPT